MHWGRGLLMVFLGALPALAGDVAGSSDYPLVPRYPNAAICLYDVEDYGRYELVVGPARVRDDRGNFDASGKHVETERLEGKVFRISYALDEDRSTLEVMRNYQIALREAGFQNRWQCEEDSCVDDPRVGRYTSYFEELNPNTERNCPTKSNFSYHHQQYLTARLTRGGGTVDAAVFISRDDRVPRVMIQVDIVESGEMDVGMELKLASEMEQEITNQGRALLYGILFDYDSDVVKPESEPALEEIKKLLDGTPSLELLVVGHTDNQGSLEYNLDLSRRRARSVVKALVARYGIAAARLEGHGVGFLAPVASNDTDEGRAKNRRVELVKRK